LHAPSRERPHEHARTYARLLQTWREQLYPLLREHLARNVDSVICWDLLFQETALANLLEVCAQWAPHFGSNSYRLLFQTA
jgi:hypothetical protein